MRCDRLYDSSCGGSDEEGDDETRREECDEEGEERDTVVACAKRKKRRERADSCVDQRMLRGRVRGIGKTRPGRRSAHYK
jgi:hypothetical protein